jgi:hypothetical protein
VKSPTMIQVQRVWTKISKDPAAHKAFVKLRKAGFPIADLQPQDPTFKNPSWADYIAALPFLPNRPSRRRIHRGRTLRKHMSLVRALRRFVVKLDDPFCQKRIVMRGDRSINDQRTLSRDLGQAAELIGKFISWDWFTRDKNPRHAVIAELRGTIRSRTGKPHDAELIALIDAAFRAAEAEDEFYPDSNHLDRIEKLEKEGRVKATGRLNFVAGIGSSPKVLRAGFSTSFSQKHRKRVQ